MRMNIDIDYELVTYMEVVRAATGKKEFYKVAPDGKTTEITELEYKKGTEEK